MSYSVHVRLTPKEAAALQTFCEQPTVRQILATGMTPLSSPPEFAGLPYLSA